MIAKDEATVLPVTLPTYRGVVDSFVIVDTGSTDGTPELAAELLADLPGGVYQADWTDYATARTEALEIAHDSADWLLMSDADMTCEHHPDLRAWLDTDPDPEVDAWQVPIVEGGSVWRRPLLLRGDQEWRYEFPVHEYLVTEGRAQRALLGLTLRHGLRQKPTSRFAEWAKVLHPLAEAGEPRAQFYYAECLRFHGETGRAAAAYDVRAANPNGFDEEQWYSAYMAARLRGDVAALLEAWELRPWRHEPLTAAARLVAATGPDNDVLFLEAAP